MKEQLSDSRLYSWQFKDTFKTHAQFFRQLKGGHWHRGLYFSIKLHCLLFFYKEKPQHIQCQREKHKGDLNKTKQWTFAKNIPGWCLTQKHHQKQVDVKASISVELSEENVFWDE